MRTVQWQGLSDGAQWAAAASVRFHADRRSGGLSAYGEQSTPDFELTWQLNTTVGWTFDRLEMRLLGLSRSRDRLNRTLFLERDATGVWRSQAWCSDSLDHPSPGLARPSALFEGRDAVIACCPLSHTAPLRRLGVLKAHRVAGPVTRVLLPSLSVVPARQAYDWVSHSAAGTVLRHWFVGERSPTGEEPALMEIDGQGVVLRYDGLARTRDSAMAA